MSAVSENKNGFTLGVQQLHPAYFALVMATGIVAIAAQLQGYHPVAMGLGVLNALQYAVLITLLVLRGIRYPRTVLADAGHHLRGPGFFTLVAGTSVLGSQALIVMGSPRVAVALGVAAFLFWVVINYGVLTLLIVKREKPEIAQGLNGGWLVAVVAAQSLAVIFALVARRVGVEWHEPLLLLGLMSWCFGGMLYVWIISLIFYRYLFLVMDPGDLTPPYWINMGALAISTLAGANLLAAASLSPLLSELVVFIKGVTFFFWATATWWIPMLIILGFWRHVVRRFPLRYDPLYWGMVFPLGMYSTCTFRLGQELHLALLAPVARGMFFVAIVVWAVVFTGMLKRLRFTLATAPAPTIIASKGA